MPEADWFELGAGITSERMIKIKTGREAFAAGMQANIFVLRSLVRRARFRVVRTGLAA